MAREEQHNQDLRATLTLSQEEARYGTTRTLNLPGGRTVTVSLPAGVQTGQEIRVEGQSIPNSQATSVLVLTIVVALAENHPPQLNQEANETFTTLIQAPPPPPTPPQPPYISGQQIPPPLSPKPRSTALTVILLFLIFLTIGGGIFAYYSRVYVPNQIIAQATATTLTQVAGTSQAHTASTAQASATLQAIDNANATAIATLQDNYNQITSTAPAFNDILNTPDLNNWDTGRNCSFSHGAYHVNIADKNFFNYCVAQATNFINFAYQVQMTIITGDYGGIVFRADGANTKFYLLRIDQNGESILYYYPDKDGKHAKNLLQKTTNLFNTGLNQTNLITVIARENHIDMYINKKYLASVNDLSLLQSGQIGVVAGDITSPTDVAYNQAQVWKLS